MLKRLNLSYKDLIIIDTGNSHGKDREGGERD